MVRFNIPPLTRSLLIVLVGLSALNAILQPVPTALSFFTRIGHGSPLLSLVPGQSFKYPWTLITASFVEQNIFELLLTGGFLFFGGRYLERAWGLKEFAKFILIICLIPNALCFIIYVFFYEISSSSRALTTTVSGGIAIQTAFFVAFKQLVPEHTVAIKGVFRMRVKHFPAVFVVVNTVAGLLLGTDTAMFLCWISFIASWTYLRFYKVSPLTTAATGGDLPALRGDASDTFAFAYFFPEPIHTPLSKICDQIFLLLVAIKVCTPFSADDIDAGNEQAIVRAEGTGLPMTRGSGRREEAERRRALALKALDQRLHGSSSRSSSTAPALLTVPAPVALPEPSGAVDQEQVKPSEENAPGS